MKGKRQIQKEVNDFMINTGEALKAPDLDPLEITLVMLMFFGLSLLVATVILGIV